MTTNNDHFCGALERRGWIAVRAGVYYTKGPSEIVFDTSSWMEIGTTTHPRMKDISVPNDENQFESTIDQIECVLGMS